MKISVPKWKIYQTRGDIKKNSWFRFDHRTVLSPKNLWLSGSDLIVWLYILSLCSDANCEEIEIYKEHQKLYGRISWREFLASIQRLQEHGWISRNGSETQTSRYTTLQDNTEHIGELPLPKLNGIDFPTLGILWNDQIGEIFPTIKACEGNRRKNAIARWKEKPDREYWVELIERIKASDFCKGKNDRGWKANFDFLIRPDTAQKILEGKYDNRQTQHSGGPSPQLQEFMREQERLRTEE